jgi:protein-tyrosine-phosphatase
VTRDVPAVLFVCVQNAGRSQMAEAIFNREAADRAVARSAGSRPARAVHPEVVEALGEVGLDVFGVRPKGLSPEVTAGADVVVTMGCGDECPVIPGARVVDWDLDDPAGRPLEEVRRIRDEIAQRVRELLDDLL